VRINSFKSHFVRKKRRFEIDGLNFIFPKPQAFLYGNKFKRYEIKERILIKKYIKEDDVILEL
jgi:hypothetical protein